MDTLWNIDVVVADVDVVECAGTGRSTTTTNDVTENNDDDDQTTRKKRVDERNDVML